MPLSTSIAALKRRAKALARSTGLPLHTALDTIAREEGYQRWSHLTAAHSAASPVVQMLEQLVPGEMVLVAARPGHGKTLLCLSLAAEARLRGDDSHVFTLDYTEEKIRNTFATLGYDQANEARAVSIHTSDDISADYVAAQLKDRPKGALIVVDYLQLLDQRRSTPPLNTQVKTLKQLAQSKQARILVIAQIDRRFEAKDRVVPTLCDVRLPNPVDLTQFDKGCFLYGTPDITPPTLSPLSG